MTLAANDIGVERGGRLILNAVTLQVAAGEIVAVIGPNGSGKSTLLRTLGGVEAPASGSITLDGEPMARMDGRALGRRIAYLPQERDVHWALPVRRLVALGRLPHGEADAAHSPSVEAALAAMDVTALAERRATELSGGELARVLLARTLAQDTRYLVADEPTAGLDMGHVLQLFVHLVRLAGEGRGIVVAVHDAGLALRYCKRTVLLKDGSIFASGASPEVITPANLASVFAADCKVATLDHVPIVVARRSLT